MVQNIQKVIFKALNNAKLNNTKVKIIFRIILCIFILAFGIISYFILSATPHTPNKKPSEKLLKTLITAPIHIRDYKYKFTGYGTVKPSTEISVSSEVKGHIIYESPKLKEGNFVKKGTILLKIDDIDYQMALKDAETQLISYAVKIKMAKHDIKDGKDMLRTKLKSLELEENDYNRKNHLKKKGAISTGSLEAARIKLSEARHAYIKINNEIKKFELELESLRANLARAKVKQIQAQAQLNKCMVKAPISGRLEKISLSSGEYVSDGTILFELNNKKDIEIDVPVDINDALYLTDFENNSSETLKAENWLKLIKNTSITIYWTGNIEKYKWRGKIARIKKFDAETRTLTLEVKPTKYIGKTLNSVPLIEGMFCKIQFKGKTIKNTVMIPWAALQLNEKIFVVDKKNIVEERTPQILNSNNNEIIISAKGIEEGEHIVTQRIPQNIVNGTKVKILVLKQNKTHS
jgi:RND family efflux transporter MFP subunit